MNAALRLLRNELVWLADAEKRARFPQPEERVSPALTLRYRLQIMRERREVEEAIEMIEMTLDDFHEALGPMVAMLEARQ